MSYKSIASSYRNRKGVLYRGADYGLGGEDAQRLVETYRRDYEWRAFRERDRHLGDDLWIVFVAVPDEKSLEDAERDRYDAAAGHLI